MACVYHMFAIRYTCTLLKKTLIVSPLTNNFAIMISSPDFYWLRIFSIRQECGVILTQHHMMYTNTDMKTNKILKRHLTSSRCWKNTRHFLYFKLICVLFDYSVCNWYKLKSNNLLHLIWGRQEIKINPRVPVRV